MKMKPEIYDRFEKGIHMGQSGEVTAKVTADQMNGLLAVKSMTSNESTGNLTTLSDGMNFTGLRSKSNGVPMNGTTIPTTEVIRRIPLLVKRILGEPSRTGSNRNGNSHGLGDTSSQYSAETVGNEPTSSELQNHCNGIGINGTTTTKKLRIPQVINRKTGQHVRTAASHTGNLVEHRITKTVEEETKRAQLPQTKHELKKSRRVAVPVLMKPKDLHHDFIGEPTKYFKVAEISAEGLVSLKPLIAVNGSAGSPIFWHALDHLQYYARKEVLVAVLSKFARQCSSFFITFAEAVSARFNEKNLYQYAIKLYQDYPHGKVEVNRLMQLEIHSELHSSYVKYFNNRQPTKIIKILPTGDIWLRVFPEFEDIVLSYMDYNVNVTLPSPESFEDLLTKSPYELNHQLFVTLLNGSFRRIRIQKVFAVRKTIQVCFIDSGEVEEITAPFVYNCYKVDSNWANFPSLVMKCHLSGIASVDVQMFEEEVARLHYGNDVWAQFVRPVEDIEDMEVTPEIQLFSGQCQAYLNEKLIHGGLAVPEPPDYFLELFTKDKYLRKAI